MFKDFDAAVKDLTRRLAFRQRLVVMALKMIMVSVSLIASILQWLDRPRSRSTY